MIDRRTFIAGSGAGAALVVLGAPSLCAQPAAAVTPEEHGARGDGRSDDTAALQAAMNATPPGGRLRLRRGAVYRVDTNARPTHRTNGGLQLRRGVILDLNGAELRALPSSEVGGAVVQADRVHDWSVVGPGRIIGERLIHRGRTGEWGHGIAVFASSRWTVGPNVEIAECWGDGLCAAHSIERPDTYCEDWVVTGVHVHDCRRNGISIVGGRNGVIRNSYVHDVAGTAPRGGIDLEPDSIDHPNRNIHIDQVRTHGVQFGVIVATGNERIRITGSNIEGANSGIVIGERVVGLDIIGNQRIASTVGGAEGASIRVAAIDSSTINGVTIRSNTIEGGGFYVFEFGAGTRNLIIDNNRIRASNRGTLGFARMMGGGTFTRNVASIEPGAGKAGEFYVQLHDVTIGQNRFENRSGVRMRPLHYRVRDTGGNLVAATLLPN
ncbi:MAG TPA: twin-arginine translocation signal domain-containing protein [Allosphingosinicella sp.]|jgi:hypothetical protein